MSKVLVDRYMLERVSKAAEAFYSLYKRTIVSGCVPLEVLEKVVDNWVRQLKA